MPYLMASGPALVPLGTRRHAPIGYMSEPELLLDKRSGNSDCESLRISTQLHETVALAQAQPKLSVRRSDASTHRPPVHAPQS
uniref:Uncharacterized protein n=1 Tax=Globodera pallida TaxID=36090 RepID=A0A183CTC7_GLOPA